MKYCVILDHAITAFDYIWLGLYHDYGCDAILITVEPVLSVRVAIFIQKIADVYRLPGTNTRNHVRYIRSVLLW